MTKLQYGGYKFEEIKSEIGNSLRHSDERFKDAIALARSYLNNLISKIDACV